MDTSVSEQGRQTSQSRGAPRQAPQRSKVTMRVISVLSRKGGVGKTMVSQLLAYGLGARGYPVVLVQTDVRAQVPPQDAVGRPYWTIGVKGEPDQAGKETASAIHKTSLIPGSILILDGGANRRQIDYKIAELSDLSLIPVGTSYEDIAVAKDDYEDIRAYLAAQKIKRPVMLSYILNRWPGDKKRLGSLVEKPWIKPFLDETRNQRFPFRVNEIPSMMDLGFDAAPTATIPVRLAARNLTGQICKLLNLPPPPNDPLHEPDVDAEQARSAADAQAQAD